MGWFDGGRAEISNLRRALDRVAERLEQAYEANEIARPDPFMSEMRDIFEFAGMTEDGGVCRFPLPR